MRPRPRPFTELSGHRIGPGRKTLWTVWRPVLKGSKSDRRSYRKPNVLKRFRRAAGANP